MKLQEIAFLDLEKKEHEYVYTYGVFATSILKKKYFKLVFKSKIPHFMWTEIQKMMINQGIYFEDLEKGVPKNIKIGKLEYLDLTKEDIDQFGTNPENWKMYLNDATKKQMALEYEYNELYGRPDLTGTGFYSDYDPKKNW